MTAHLIFAPMDMRVFNRWAAGRGLVKRGTFDQGFALHVLLSSTFGKGVLQPFRLIASPRRRAASLYAYSDEDQTTLQRMAETVATPDCLEALDMGRLRSKRMRMEYSTGQHLGFDLRVRPVRRLHSEVAHLNGRVLAKGSEIDVCWSPQCFKNRRKKQPMSTSHPPHVAKQFTQIGLRSASAVLQRSTPRAVA